MVRKTAELLVHSFSRNTTTPSDSKKSVNNYSWEIGTVLKNVESIEVLYAEIPNTYYNIYAGANTVSLKVHETDKSFDIAEGNYTPVELVTALNAALVANTVAVPGGTITLSAYLSFVLDSTLDQIYLSTIQAPPGNSFVVTLDGPYSFGLLEKLTKTFSGNALKWYFGGTVRLGTESCLYLSIPEIGRNGTLGSSRFNFGTNSTNGIVINTDNVLSRFQTMDGVNYMNYFTNERGMHQRLFHEPFNLSRLTIRWLRPNGTLVDFNGADHSMHLRVWYDD